MHPDRPIQSKTELSAIYDRYASERDEDITADWKVLKRQEFLEAIKLENVRTLLELGSGPGRDGLFFQQNGLRVTCVDLSPAMVLRCREKGLQARVMDMTSLDFEDECFDAVYSLNALLHLTKPEFRNVLREVERILKPGGLFSLGVYGGYEFEGILERDHYVPKRFFSYFTDEQIQALASQVFDIVSFSTVLFEQEEPFHFQSLILKKRLFLV